MKNGLGLRSSVATREYGIVRIEERSFEPAIPAADQPGGLSGFAQSGLADDYPGRSPRQFPVRERRSGPGCLNSFPRFISGFRVG
jgi:hypothetical protein